MTLIVEDGSGVPNANSYVSVAEFKSWADARGYDLPTGETELEALLLRAMDYIEFNPKPYCGNQAYPDLQFPRTDLRINGFDVVGIPKQLKMAQMQLGVEATLYDELRPSKTGSAVTMEKVDVIQVSYASPQGGADLGLYLSTVEGFLEPLYCDSLHGAMVRTKRA